MSAETVSPCASASGRMSAAHSPVNSAASTGCGGRPIVAGVERRQRHDPLDEPAELPVDLPAFFERRFVLLGRPHFAERNVDRGGHRGDGRPQFVRNVRDGLLFAFEGPAEGVERCRDPAVHGKSSADNSCRSTGRRKSFSDTWLTASDRRSTGRRPREMIMRLRASGRQWHRGIVR